MVYFKEYEHKTICAKTIAHFNVNTKYSTCVKTDWRSIPNRTAIPPSSGGGGVVLSPVIPTTPTTPVNSTPPPTVTAPGSNGGRIKKPTQPKPAGSIGESPVQAPGSIPAIFDTNGDGQPDIAPNEKPVTDNETQIVGGVYKSLFPIRSPKYVNQEECLFCIILRKDAPGESMHKEPILKWAFVPKKYEWRLPLANTFLQKKNSAPLPDLDLTSTIGTGVVTYGLWKLLALLLLK